MKYIALFRGINVGGKNSLPMKELIAVLEGLGLKQIETYIQSGNVVFSSKKSKNLAVQIGEAVEKAKGFYPRVMLLTEDELNEAVRSNPFDTSNGKALHFFFLEEAAVNPDLGALEAAKTKTEAFRLCDRTLYLYTPDGFGKSKLAEKIEKAMGVPVTARNWNTIGKLLTMMGT